MIWAAASAQVKIDLEGRMLQPNACWFYAAGPEGACVGRCGVYTENGGPVRILSGVGLDVEDDDHNEVFLMEV